MSKGKPRKIFAPKGTSKISLFFFFASRLFPRKKTIKFSTFLLGQNFVFGLIVCQNELLTQKFKIMKNKRRFFYRSTSDVEEGGQSREDCLYYSISDEKFKGYITYTDDTDEPKKRETIIKVMCFHRYIYEEKREIVEDFGRGGGYMYGNTISESEEGYEEDGDIETIIYHDGKPPYALEDEYFREISLECLSEEDKRFLKNKGVI